MRIKAFLQTICRDWLKYRISGDRTYLNNAYQSAFSALKSNKSSIELYFFYIYISIEKGEYDRAGDLLDSLTSYKNYFKGNQPDHYAYYLYLYALFDTRRNKHRPAKKYSRMLEEYSVGKPKYIYDLLLASLKLESYEYEAAYEFLNNAYTRGCRSPFLFISLHEYYTNDLNRRVNVRNIFLPYLRWSLTHGLSLTENVDIYKNVLTELMKSHKDIRRKLIDTYSESWVIQTACHCLIDESDFSKDALYIYNEAISRQVFTDEINMAFIKAAYRNEFEEVPRYSLIKFLEKELDVESKPFIYHLILTNKKSKDFAAHLHNQIVQLAIYALENNLKGRLYNSVYKYILEVGESDRIPKNLVAKAEIFLVSELFVYELRIEDKNCKFIWIQEKEKRGLQIYKIEDGDVVIKAASDSFVYYCLDENQKQFIDCDVKIKKRIQNADIKLYQHFFRKEIISTELLIEMSKHCMSLENPNRESIEILEMTLAEPKLSYSFRMTGNAVLGNIYYAENDYIKAFEYYKDINENYLQEKYVEQMLLVFIAAKAYDRAVALMLRKEYCIAEKILFYAIKELQDEKHRQEVTEICYNLILKSWYDKVLLDIVLKYYVATQEQWQQLSIFLRHMAVETKELDEKILENAVLIRKLDAGSQSVLKYMYESEPHNKYVEEFIYYIVYEIIVNSTKVEDETIDILERSFINTGEHLIAYALCHLYIENNVVTKDSYSIMQKAIEYLEQDGYIFPVFKLLKDKRLMTPYIEKNQPFIYKTLPDKNVYLHYKVDGHAGYKAKKMVYRHFGMYTTTLLHFYGDKIVYYFSEQLPTGSIDSKASTVYNTRMNLQENTKDSYYEINNALICEQMFKYDVVEQIITDRLRDVIEVKAKLL